MENALFKSPRYWNSQTNTMTEQEVEALIQCREELAETIDPMYVAIVMRDNNCLQEEVLNEVIASQKRNSLEEMPFSVLFSHLPSNVSLSKFVQNLDMCGYKKTAARLFLTFLKINNEVVTHVSKTAAGQRPMVHKFFRNLKRMVHDAQFKNPRTALRELALRYVEKMSSERDDMKRQMLADKCIAVIGAEIDAIAITFDTSLHRGEPFTQMKSLTTETSNTLITDVVYFGRLANAHSIAGRFDDSENMLRAARCKAYNIGPCLELVNMLYIEVYVRLWQFEHKPSKELRQALLMWGRIGLESLEEEDVDTKRLWRRMFILRMVFCLLGLGNRANLITNCPVDEACMQEARDLLSDVYKNWYGIEARRKMFYFVARARLLELDGQFTGCLETLACAKVVAEEGHFEEKRFIVDFIDKVKGNVYACIRPKITQCSETFLSRMNDQNQTDRLENTTVHDQNQTGRLENTTVHDQNQTDRLKNTTEHDQSQFGRLENTTIPTKQECYPPTLEIAGYNEDRNFVLTSSPVSPILEIQNQTENGVILFENQSHEYADNCYNWAYSPCAANIEKNMLLFQRIEDKALEERDRTYAFFSSNIKSRNSELQKVGVGRTYEKQAHSGDDQRCRYLNSSLKMNRLKSLTFSSGSPNDEIENVSVSREERPSESIQISVTNTVGEPNVYSAGRFLNQSFQKLQSPYPTDIIQYGQSESPNYLMFDSSIVEEGHIVRAGKTHNEPFERLKSPSLSGVVECNYGNGPPKGSTSPENSSNMLACDVKFDNSFRRLLTPTHTDLNEVEQTQCPREEFTFESPSFHGGLLQTGFNCRPELTGQSDSREYFVPHSSLRHHPVGRDSAGDTILGLNNDTESKLQDAARDDVESIKSEDMFG
ncbi:uncharacterized protein LOC128239403 [Mya arenaria]|uniref:uncharacterized protein LOC128239403 n=1 Tax=Mya arenaria TaxID=6604 RepID=UPI0022E34DD0|nr:uncharacterized protein LOC128239403 [Mya arenaria]